MHQILFQFPFVSATGGSAPDPQGVAGRKGKGRERERGGEGKGKGGKGEGRERGREGKFASLPLGIYAPGSEYVTFPSRPAVECNPGQVVNTHVPLSSSSIIWYQPMGGDALRLGR